MLPHGNDNDTSKAQTLGTEACKPKWVVLYLLHNSFHSERQTSAPVSNQMCNIAVKEVKYVAQGNTAVDFYWNPLFARQ